MKTLIMLIIMIIITVLSIIFFLKISFEFVRECYKHNMFLFCFTTFMGIALIMWFVLYKLKEFI